MLFALLRYAAGYAVSDADMRNRLDAGAGCNKKGGYPRRRGEQIRIFVRKAFPMYRGFPVFASFR